MTLFKTTEVLVACDACGFAGLVGPRHQEWVPHQMATTAERWVRFAVCTLCGVTCVGPSFGGALGWQPAPLRLSHGTVQLAAWEAAEAGTAPDVCPACREPDGLLWWASDESELNRAWCPLCWAGPLRLTDGRASHPGW